MAGGEDHPLALRQAEVRVRVHGVEGRHQIHPSRRQLEAAVPASQPVAVRHPLARRLQDQPVVAEAVRHPRTPAINIPLTRTPSRTSCFAQPSRRVKTGIMIGKEDFPPSGAAFEGHLRRASDAPQMQRAA
jgi:hypothetical protein